MILPVGQSEALRVPWITGWVILACLAVFVADDSELVVRATPEPEQLAEATEYWREHAYLEAQPEILVEVGRGKSAEERRELVQELRYESYQRWPVNGEMRLAQQEVLDFLTSQALGETERAVDASNIFMRWGLVPAEPKVLAFFTHGFLHASWLQLLANLLILFLAGAALEERWGPLLALLLPICAVVSGGVALLVSLGSTFPLFGAAGMSAGLVGAALARYRLQRVRCYYLLGVDRKGPIRGSFTLPAIALLLPLWLASAAGQDFLPGVGVGALVAGQLTGLVVGAGLALLVARLGLEERLGLLWLRTWWDRLRLERANRREAKREAATKSESEEAAEGPEGGSELDLLKTAAEGNPGDPEAGRAFWEAARSAGQAALAAPQMLRLVHHYVNRGEDQEAAQTWIEVTTDVPRALAYPTLLVRLCPALVALGEHDQAQKALRQAIDPRNRGLTLPNALRAVRHAKELDPALSVAAAKRALEMPDVPLDERAALGELIDAGGALPQEAEAPQDAQAKAARAQQETVPRAAPASAAAGVQSPTTPAIGVDSRPPPPAVDSSAGGPRFGGVKIVEGTPARFSKGGLFIQVAAGRMIELKYARVEALAAAMVVRSLGQSPEIVIDLALNWSQAGDQALRIVRLRSDGFDPRTLIPDEDSLEDAYRAFLDKLLTLTRALPLPDEESARGRPMRVYSDLDTYQREVLEVEG